MKQAAADPEPTTPYRDAEVSITRVNNCKVPEDRTAPPTRQQMAQVIQAARSLLGLERDPVVEAAHPPLVHLAHKHCAQHSHTHSTRSPSPCPPHPQTLRATPPHAFNALTLPLSTSPTNTARNTRTRIYDHSPLTQNATTMRAIAITPRTCTACKLHVRVQPLCEQTQSAAAACASPKTHQDAPHRTARVTSDVSEKLQYCTRAERLPSA